MSLDPIEPFLRIEEPPDDTVVILRGGPIAVEKIVEHALREARAYSFGGSPLFSVSVSLAVAGWTVDELLAGPLASRCHLRHHNLGNAARLLGSSRSQHSRRPTTTSC